VQNSKASKIFDSQPLGWVICRVMVNVLNGCSLYVIALFLGPHVGYTKLLCFLCEWDSRAKDHCKRNAGLIEQFLPGV